MLLTIAGLVAVTGLAWSAYAEEHETKTKQGDIYTLKTCPVSGEKLGSMGDPVVKKYDGREVRLCCEGCVAKFEENKAEYWKKIDAAMIKQQKARYPLKTCVVSGQELGSMGEPVDKVYKNQLVRFCCAGCPKTFEKDPAKYTKKIDAAVVEKQKDDYPLETCLVSGQKLGSMGDPVEYVAGDRLVRFCCKGCVKQFEKDPQKYLSKLDEESNSTNEGS
jgi:YHS domain-containing protein